MASAWVASNCTSNWNGSRFRIDLLRNQSIQNLLATTPGFKNDEDVEINITGNAVMFRYTTVSGETVTIMREAIAQYRIQNGHAVRQAPIALSYGGFIHEWLSMDDAEAARWSTPEAAATHHDMATRFNRFEWDHAASCLGPPAAREIVVRNDESKATGVFLIAGATAAEMRMQSVSDQRTPGCREIEISPDSLGSIIAEPPK
jgi:hypothetical protein